MLALKCTNLVEHWNKGPKFTKNDMIYLFCEKYSQIYNQILLFSLLHSYKSLNYFKTMIVTGGNNPLNFQKKKYKS